MVIAAAIGLVLVGIAVGVLLDRVIRSRHSTDVDDGERSDAQDAEVSALLVSAVDHLEIGVVVATDADRIVYRNLATSAFSGTLVGVLVDDHLASIITEAQSGRRVARTVELQGPPKTWLAISADPTPGGAWLPRSRTSVSVSGPTRCARTS
jgi:hypothetical protein